MQRGPGSWAVVTVALLIVAAAVWFSLGRGERGSVPERTAVAPDAPRQGDAAETRSRRAPGADIPVPDREALEAEDSESDAAGDLGSWEEVDLEAVRAAMPDNLYWKLAAPTRDEQVIEERAAERDRWNVEYGKILSGTANEEEIRAYYDQRARVSGDYVEFVTYVLDHYEPTLPESDVGLLKLARRMHQARLEEIPRKVEEAFQRKREQDAARETWKKEQEAFDKKD